MLQAGVGDCPLKQMPEPYSNDLRRKFFQAYDRGEGSLKELAKRFSVSKDWAKKLSARRTKTGEVEIGVWRHGPQSQVTAAIREWIERQMRRQPDLTLHELQHRLEREQRLRLSVGWIWVLLRRWGLRHKKNRSVPRSRTRGRTSGAARGGGNR
jgi:transposase